MLSRKPNDFNLITNKIPDAWENNIQSYTIKHWIEQAKTGSHWLVKTNGTKIDLHLFNAAFGEKQTFFLLICGGWLGITYVYQVFVINELFIRNYLKGYNSKLNMREQNNLNSSCNNRLPNKCFKGQTVEIILSQFDKVRCFSKAYKPLYFIASTKFNHNSLIVN